MCSQLPFPCIWALFFPISSYPDDWWLAPQPLFLRQSIQYFFVLYTITLCTLCIVSFVSISYSVFFEGEILVRRAVGGGRKRWWFLEKKMRFFYEKGFNFSKKALFYEKMVFFPKKTPFWRAPCATKKHKRRRTQSTIQTPFYTCFVCPQVNFPCISGHSDSIMLSIIAYCLEHNT